MLAGQLVTFVNGTCENFLRLSVEFVIYKGLMLLYRFQYGNILPSDECMTLGMDLNFFFEK